MGLKTSKKWPQASKRYNSTAAYPKDQLEFKFFFFEPCTGYLIGSP